MNQWSIQSCRSKQWVRQLVLRHPRDGKERGNPRCKTRTEEEEEEEKEEEEEEEEEGQVINEGDGESKCKSNQLMDRKEDRKGRRPAGIVECVCVCVCVEGGN